MLDLTIKNLKKVYFSDPVFEDINIDLKKGEKVGLLGENGTGKTTLFKIINGEETPTSGDLFLRRGLKIGYLKQMPSEYEDLNVRGVLLGAFKGLQVLNDRMRWLEKEMANNTEDLDELLVEYSKCQVKYEAMGGYEIFEKMSKICEGLRFDEAMLSKAYGVLSGGEKTRVELGKQLLESPDVLLLDEPTNHLDIETTEWLENYLKAYEGSVLIISHDRYFLDRVIDRIYEIKGGTTEIYLGNYSYYLQERQSRYENQLRHYNAQQKKLKQMEEAAKRMRDWAGRADNEAMFVRAKAMEKRIEKMDKIDKPLMNTKGIQVAFESEGRSAKEVIRVRDYHLGIGDLTLARDVNFTIRYKDHVALIGANGTGKSTLVKAILRDMDHEESPIKVGSRVNIGYLEQDIQFKDPEMTLIEAYKDYYPLPDGQIRNELAAFKFYKDHVFKKIKNLSGGEKVRLMLAILMKQDINCLVLDEPTNHIDIKTKEVLEETLESFEGTLFFITHDRFFLNKMADRIFEIEDQSLVTYEGNYEAYKIQKAKRTQSEISQYDEKDKLKTESNSKIKEKEPKERQEPVKETKKMNTYKINQMESDILEIEEAIESKKSELERLESDYVKMQEVLESLAHLEAKLEDAMEAYYAYIE